MNNIEGEFLSKGMIASGATLTTLSFPSDVSLGVAKAMFILLSERKDGFLYENLEEEKQIIYFGDCYVSGVAYFKEHEDVLAEAKSLAHIIYDENHASDIRIAFLDIQKRSEHYFRNVVTSLGSHIDDYIYESEVSESGTKIVRGAIGTIFKESEGAVIYEPGEERKDLHVAVFINGEGHPTYEAKDIGLIAKKFDTYNPDISFTVTDVEQTQHFKIVFDAASKLGGEWPSRVEKSVHVPHGRMLFKGQKMSSRLGGVPLALDVIGAVEEEVRERAGERLANLKEEEKERITREIALSALRIAVLRSKPGLNINFEPETSLSFEGDSGPYLLYTHARCFSLLEKGQEGDIMPSFSESSAPSSLERTLFHFNSVLKESIEDIAPQKLVTYLFKVAQEFNSFYGSVQIITDDKEKSAHNLAIVVWTKEVLREGLYVLGIRAVERM
jgi:arginyl-tRNA synthetase